MPQSHYMNEMKPTAQLMVFIIYTEINHGLIAASAKDVESTFKIHA